MAGEPRLTLELMRADVAELLGQAPAAVGDDDNVLQLGLDSLRLMGLASRWRKAGFEVKFSELAVEPVLSAWWSMAASRLEPAPQAAAEPEVHVDEAAPFALAPMQHAYWVGRDDGQVLGGVGAHFYNEFDGEGVEPHRLERAVRSLVARHGMLRARFLEDGRQRVDAEGAWTGLAVADLRDLPDAEAAARLDALREELAHRRLAVERGEVFDVRLSLLPGGRTRVHVAIEMLVADAHSFRVLLADLARLYEGRPLTPLRWTFARYQAERGRRPADPAARAYWQRRLAELPGPAELPLAADPAGLVAPRVRRLQHLLSRAEWDRLAERARAQAVTLPVALLTAFGEVLAAWSAQPRFLLNLPLYDREPLHPDVDGLVGDFTNLLLVAFDASEELPFAERARRLQAQVQEAAGHAAYSGVDVLRDLSRARGEPVRAPVVFTSAIGLGELFSEDVRRSFGTPGWTMSQTPGVLLDHQVTEREGELLLNWEAVEGLLPDGVLDAMFGAYQRLVGWLAEDADWEAPPPALPPEQAAVRARVNATDAPECDALLHEGFFAHAQADPGRPALLWGDGGRLSYGELADRALCLAALLRTRGVRPGEPVAITLPKGPRQVEAELAVLAAGGVCVPVGVDQPALRRARIHRSAGARTAVTDAATLAALEWPDGVRPVALEEAAATEPLPGPAAVWREAPGYVIYTSGSTGEPKGVVVSHRAAMNTIADLNRRLAVGPDDRCLAVSALDFDLSVYDVFGLLSAGGAVVAVEEDARRDAARWAELVAGRGVTLVNCVPALLDMLLTAGAGRLGSLRAVLLGGDWVGVDLPGRLAAEAPGCRFLALGGTTETAIHSTICEVAEVPAHWRSMPYGTPLANVRCRVADTRRRDRPDWVPGELWIGGAGVADGYRGDIERTARVFVDHEGERWYRTGDLACYWPDGTLEFLGRADFQVKVRGHRIELGEIEAALAAHPGVRQAVAVVAEGRLAAAVVGPAAPGELRAFAADRLPAHMVPERFETLDVLPLSANGKVDRRAIGRAVAAAEDPEGAEPAGPVEQAVAAAWAEVLGRPHVGRDQGFFALGGDSLVATRLLVRVRELGIEGARLSELFRTPVLRDFAAGLRLGEAPAALAGPVADPEHRHEPFPSTDVQRAYWLGRSPEFTLGGVGSHWYWEFDGEGVDLDRLEAAWNRLIARHEMLRAVFDDQGLQRVLPEVPRFTISVEQAAGDEAAALAAFREAMAHQVLDLTRWPLFDVRALRHGDGRTRLGLSFDYILVDALSIMLVLSELGRFYEEPDAELPPVGLSFRDYVLGVRPEAEHEEASRRHWLARLDDLPPGPQLPLRLDPAAVVRPRFTRRAARLTPEQWSSVVARARSHDLTPSTVVAAAYAEVLSAWSARPDLTLTFTRFDRLPVHPDIQTVLGDFTSLLLVSHRPNPEDGWLDVAHRLQREVWSGLEHSGVSALWVLRELARRSAAVEAAMPVVFTSALGVAPEGFRLGAPFGEYVDGLSQTPQVWLDNQVMELDGGLACNWDAVEELFPDGVLDAMFGAYVRLLEWLAEPGADWFDRPPEALPAVQRAVRQAANATGDPLPGGLLQDGFFARAAERPERPALVWAEGSLTYGEVADRALRAAGALVTDGVAPGERVAVALPRGPAQAVAVLGVLAAGGAYVPIGLDQPPHRVERMLAGAGVTRVLTDAAHAGDPRWPAGVRALALEATRKAPPLAGPVAVRPDAVAYVIFTSGSSGEPKGVMVAHRAALNTVDDVSRRWGVGEDDRVLAVSALDFDLSVYDLFGPLSAGGAVVLPAEEDRREARRWARLVAAHGVTVWNSVPALLEMLLSSGDEDWLRGLRLALVSGDWVGLDLPARLRARAPGCRFVALGGATEAAIWSNACEVAEVPAHWRSIPYGRPLRAQRFRVVDAAGRDRPDWVPGELWIGGAGVAEGYSGSPELTAQRFVARDGGRWYRTGDLGRYWPDGTLEFLGRTDHQVKVRGHRIELGEVEAALTAHPSVAAAAVLAAGEPAGHLVAFVAMDGDPDVLPPFLAGRLPAAMLPERIVPLAALPLTANGKVDRRALAHLASERPALDEAGPEGPVETAVAALWADLLAVPRVGRGQSFFALGGDSRLATQLAESVRREFGVEVSLRELFATPTVGGLATLIAALRDSEPDFEEGWA
jgi:yersiniabactin nonribosomal peptide synthetase